MIVLWFLILTILYFTRNVHLIKDTHLILVGFCK
ncbi:unnamed protein product [Brassica rapa subsp. trilocularis]